MPPHAAPIPKVHSTTLALLITAVAACADPATSPRDLAATNAASEIALPLPQTASGRFAAALEQFGGAFVSNGVLHVAVTESSAASDARRIVDEHLRASPRGPMTIAIVPARYSYRQLWDWQATILHDWAILQLRSVAVDERANRLRIGVGDSVAALATRARISGFAIPTDAFSVEIVGTPTMLATLNSRLRPTHAGIRTTSVAPQSSNIQRICTYGPNVSVGGERHMVTNSHCTDGELGIMSDAVFYQPAVSTLNRYGREIIDPPYESGLPGCPTGKLCRYSDAALVKVTDTSSNGWEVATVARPVQRAVLPTLSGSLEIDAANSKFTLTAVLTHVFQGDTVEKVGRHSGWTAGEVSLACITQIAAVGSSYVNLCTIGAFMGAGEGDSGAPVLFRNSQGQYLLVGILWGGASPSPGESVGEQMLASWWTYVNSEIGPLDPFTWSPPPTPEGCGGGLC